MVADEQFPCFMVRKSDDGTVRAAVESLSKADLAAGEVLIRVAWSSLNYKDALASQGHPGVVRTFPHVPGIDCAGTVVESASSDFPPGDEVLVTGYELGASHWGGYAGYVRVPADWVVALPNGLSMRDAMVHGTAGFTAAQCVSAIVARGIKPDRGPVVVTGATGGVGCIAVAILANLGYDVAAVTGKADQHDWLRRLGANTILGRNDVDDASNRPMLEARWTAAVDTVGGRPLATLIRSIDHRGCVAACGLVAGTDLNLTVYPFILRGVTLAGIDSAKCPRPERLEIWRKLSGEWKLDQLDQIAHEVTLSELQRSIDEILHGRIVGRTLVKPVASS
jgi:putative YhdH/YhfP family quinone oxidoreductase